MNKTIVWLSALLGLQVVIAGGLFATSWQQSNHNPSQALLNFDAAIVDKIEISAGDQQVVLNKTADGWQLPELSALPAVQSKVNNVVNKLTTTTASWPVATSKTSQERFEVTAEQYQRKIRLFAGDKLASEVYLGTSPGFRQVHARRPDENEIYAVTLNTFDFPAQASDWLDKQLIAVSEPSRLSGKDFTLEKSGEDWQFSTTAPLLESTTAQLDPQQAETLVSAFANLRVNQVTALPEETSSFEFSVATDEQSYVYHFHAHDDEYFVRRDDVDAAFSISKFHYDKFAEASFDTLAKHDTTDDKTNADGEQSTEVEASE